MNPRVEQGIGGPRLRLARVAPREAIDIIDRDGHLMPRTEDHPHNAPEGPWFDECRCTSRHLRDPKVEGRNDTHTSFCNRSLRDRLGEEPRVSTRAGPLDPARVDKRRPACSWQQSGVCLRYKFSPTPPICSPPGFAVRQILRFQIRNYARNKLITKFIASECQPNLGLNIVEFYLVNVAKILPASKAWVM